MRSTIRERCKNVAEYTKNRTLETIELIAAATGLSKSSVQRHQQAIKRRARYAESFWWETQVGSEWLKRLVLGVVYYFGIKQGVGAESLSTFLAAIHLEQQVGISASALRQLEERMRQAIVAYAEVQSNQCHPPVGQGLCVGGDETFFGLPVLVMVELASGYILTEVECENRSYQTWLRQIQHWWSKHGWQCHFMVSDRAKALIKLAVEGLGCVSVSDLFHALRALAQPLGSAIARQLAQLSKQQTALQQQLEGACVASEQQRLKQAIATLAAQQQQLTLAQTSYHQALHAITQLVHPFHPVSQDWQLWRALSSTLDAPLLVLSTLASTYATAKAHNAIASFKTQIPSLAQGIHAWWQWVTQALSVQSDDLQVQAWVLTALLPWVYWQQQTDKTRQSELKSAYQQATERAYQHLLTHSMTQHIDDTQRQSWITWCQWMAAKYQRTSSAVEGRNGYLSRLHHAARGLSSQTLQVLTIIHNFDLKRADGTTAAERLFDHSFPDVFEWVVEHMGDLPLARRSSKAHQPKPLPTPLFPA